MLKFNHLPLQPRNYQIDILKKVVSNTMSGLNTLIELDCGGGKRFLQYALIAEVFKDKKILLLMQASTSLYETYRYFTSDYKFTETSLIDSRKPTILRKQIIKEGRIILSLPQALYNTVKDEPELLELFDVVIVNEVDQIIRRTAHSSILKQPYPKILRGLGKCTIIGMSGTLRDDHYVIDQEQLKIRNELSSLTELIGNCVLISMDEILGGGFEEYVSKTYVIPTGVEDQSIFSISTEIEAFIQDYKQQIVESLDDPFLRKEVESNIGIMLSEHLNIDPALQRKYSQGFLLRKYLWGMPGENVYRHLIRYGLDQNWISNTLRDMPKKFHVISDLVRTSKKTVILCSYISTCDFLERLLQAQGFNTRKITGKVPHSQRDEALQEFRRVKESMVLVISNVGERDLDIPEADLLILFDLVRTTKTVYQKLKRIRGGTCRILFYKDTKEEQKAQSVLSRLMEKYPWSTELKSIEIIS